MGKAYPAPASHMREVESMLLAMLASIAAAVHGAAVPVVWIIGLILIVAGIVSLVRGSLLGGILLILLGIFLGGLNVV